MTLKDVREQADRVFSAAHLLVIRVNEDDPKQAALVDLVARILEACADVIAGSKFQPTTMSVDQYLNWEPADGFLDMLRKGCKPGGGSPVRSQIVAASDIIRSMRAQTLEIEKS